MIKAVSGLTVFDRMVLKMLKELRELEADIIATLMREDGYDVSHSDVCESMCRLTEADLVGREPAVVQIEVPEPKKT